MDYYNILGLQRGASQEDIKKAYRSMAMKHHPDRGGDEKKFKEISQAYDILSNPEKKRMVDSGIDPNAQQHSGFQQGPFEFHFGGMPPGMEDIFGHFGFGNFKRPQRNKTFSINVKISLEEVITGKQVDAEIGLPHGEKKLINISIPAGVADGQNIRYQGMGDNTYKDSPAGDLIVNIFVSHHPKFTRENDNLIYHHKVSVWDALLGSDVELSTLDHKNIKIVIPPGTQPETILSCRGEGLPNVRTKIRGNLLIKITVEIPRLLTGSQIELIKKLKDGL